MTLVEILGWTGSVLVVLSLTQSHLGRLRTINLVASILHLIFNIILGIFPMIALNLVLTGINAYYLSTKHKPSWMSPKRRHPAANPPQRYQTALVMARSFEMRAGVL